MNENILINKNETKTGWEFEVTVEEEGRGQTNHKVIMDENFYESLDTDQPPENIVKESFKFLLERESKESILSNFDITLIQKYFPEYKRIIKNRLE